MNGYTIEIATEHEKIESTDDREDILSSVVSDLGIDRSNIDFGPPGRELSADPATMVAVGSLIVSSVDLLLTIYEKINEEEDFELNAMSTADGETIYTDEFDKTTVQNNGGTVIGEVEGDLIFTADFESLMEIKEKEETADDE